MPGSWRRHAVAAASIALATLLLAITSGFDYAPLAVPAEVAAGAESDARARLLRAEHLKLTRELQRLAPRGAYIVIDQTNNRLYLRRGGETLRQAVASAGSGMILRETRSGRSWVFDTPRGEFRVLSKTENPVWRKPDWAFLEEGKPIPANAGERFENGVLGEYALYFGDGFLIHGTLYERLLGRSVTHGCIRLGRDDLRVVYRASPLGTPIFIF